MIRRNILMTIVAMAATSVSAAPALAWDATQSTDQVLSAGRVVADVPAALCVDDAPRYERPAARPAWQEMVARLQLEEIPEPADGTGLRAFIARPGARRLIPKRSCACSWSATSSGIVEQASGTGRREGSNSVRSILPRYRRPTEPSAGLDY